MNISAAHVRLSIRKVFAALLLCTALVPAGLVAVFFLASPNAAYAAAGIGGTWAWRGLLGALGVFVLALLYPPFLPFVRLWARRTWQRLGTDRGPMHEGMVRLRHLDTHADRLLVGRMARQLGEHALALENLQRALELDPTHVAGRYQLALLLATLGRAEEAVPLLEAVVESDERHAFGDALFHLGRCRFRLQKHDAALAALRRHQALFPGNRQVHLVLARLLAATGSLEEAEIERRQAARPASDREMLSPEERLARARAKVTILRRGGAA